MSSKNHALIFGASGISGWALVKEALSYPTSTTFDYVTGLTNRPLSISESYLPQNDSRLQLVSGIDLTGSVDSVVKGLKEKVKHAETISHVFFTAYIDPGKGYDALKEVNMKILKTAMEALPQVAPELKHVVLQTGGKAYGVEFPDKLEIKTPLKESQPRIPEPYASNIFYYPQYDLLKSLSSSASWSFIEVRPDVIVGFVPNNNFMSAAQGLGLYLSLYREVHGEGAKIVFPGSIEGYQSKATDTFQDVLAKFEIYASLHPDKTGNGESFNIADDAKPLSWEQKWGPVCSYFGLKGVGPDSDFEPAEQFVKANLKTWDDLVKNRGLKSGQMEKYQWGFLDFVVGKATFDREYDLSKARSTGFDETIDTVKSYATAFDRMRQAMIIP